MKKELVNHFLLPSGITGVLVIVICFFAGCGVTTSIADTMLILGAAFGLSHVVRIAYLMGLDQGKREVTGSSSPALKKKPLTVNQTLLQTTQQRQTSCNPCKDFG